MMQQRWIKHNCALVHLVFVLKSVYVGNGYQTNQSTDNINYVSLIVICRQRLLTTVGIRQLHFMELTQLHRQRMRFAEDESDWRKMYTALSGISRLTLVSNGVESNNRVKSVPICRRLISSVCYEIIRTDDTMDTSVVVSDNMSLFCESNTLKRQYPNSFEAMNV